MNAKLEQAIAAVRSLPEHDQELIAGAMLDDVARMRASPLTAEQLAIVRDRLSRPLEVADRAEINELLRRYSSSV